MKKAQIYGQLFIYILTIVLVSFILVYGYNAVKSLNDRAEQISCLKLKNDLISAVESISSDFGSIKRKDIELCGNYKQVCFVETFENLDRSNPQGTNDPIIIDNIKSNTGKNAFLLENIAKESFYIGVISVDNDVLCIKSTGNRLSLRLEGRGNHVLLSRWA